MGKQKRQVAIIDVGSLKISAVVAERGINDTFVIKAKYDFNYDGYSGGAFFDTEELKKVLFSASDFLRKSLREQDKTVYVGVPGAFCEVVIKDSQISFDKKRKITENCVASLFDAAFVMSSTKKTLINRSAIVYELEDFRRLVNPIGAYSETLKGKLSFTLCDNYFIDAVKPTLNSTGFSDVEFVSMPLAEALYLVEPETRDRIAVICDVGYISSTLTIVQGDGILFQKSFDYGGGYISASISEQFSIDYDAAENLKKKISLSTCPKNGNYEVITNEEGQYFNAEELKNTILASLDRLCEEIANSIEQSGYTIPEYVSLMITGGGISFLRGAKEHVAGRLNMPVEIIKPRVPLMEKPTESSVLSLLDIALKQ